MRAVRLRTDHRCEAPASVGLTNAQEAPMKRKTFLIAASLTALAAGAQAAPTYTVQNVQFPTDPGFTQLNGINDAGVTVGTHGAAVNQGFMRSPGGSFTNENFPGSAQTQLTGVSANKTAVGIYVDAGGTTHGFAAFPQVTGTTFSTYDQSGTVFNQLLGISADGTRFAGYSSAIDAAGMVGQQAYTGSIAGKTFTSINGLLPANFNSQATGVNNAGAVVGFYMNTAATSLGFEEIGGKVMTLDPFGSTNTQALGIAASGEIVGVYTDAGGVQHGYTDLHGKFASFDPTGSVGTTINGVNDLGQLVGFFTNAAGSTVGFEASPVAEPGSLAVLGAGAIGLFGMVRRRPA